MPSSVIAAMHYQKTTSTLRITFISGLVYNYQNVPEEIYIAMKESDLKGTFLNTVIKSSYAYENAGHQR
ncbi:MAG: KTSC domain-containing protein [Aquabacterium sp.]|nr:KTSC domain-containing protein [Ferruginibacter sp.]